EFSAPMEHKNDTFTYSASDLSTHLSCKHATQLNRLAALQEVDRPFRTDPVLDALRKRGLEHEEQYVKPLIAQGKSATDSTRKTLEETVEEMRAGKDVIVQGHLASGPYMGYPDILIKVPGESKFGDWSYEVQDTKLSTNTRASTIIQLCFYSDLLETIQGTRAEIFSVVMPGQSVDEPFRIVPYRLNDFRAFYSFVKNRFLAFMEGTPPS